SKRVFINNVDKYTSKYVAQFLSSCVPGASYVAKQFEDEEEIKPSSQGGTFEIVGTVSGSEKKSGFAVEEYTNLTRQELFHHLNESDVVVYNIYNENADQIEEASWAVSALHGDMNSFPRPKTFILISTLMTWALIKPLDTDDAETPFTEEDYRRRKPHHNFNDHIAVEKLVVKLGRSNQSQFSTYVLASGLQYGMGEQAFHFFFKTSWLGEEQEVPIFGDGSNFVPTIHINDLAGIVQNVIDYNPKPQYLLAVDESYNTIAEIISVMALGPGKTRNVPKEDVILLKELTQAEIDHLFISLRMEAFFVTYNFSIKWVSKKGIVDNIDQVVEEYKLARGLLPVRICVLGPPAVGKSTVSEKICKHYKLHHVKLKETITETLAHLESKVQMEESNEDDESQEAQELLNTLKTNMEENDGRLDEQCVLQIMKDKLKTKPCINQGFVLDGFPKSYNQAKELFSGVSVILGMYLREFSSAAYANTFHFSSIFVCIEYVFCLDATDEFLKERVLDLPESVVEETSYSFDTFLSRLEMYRKNNSDDEIVINYFDEQEIPPQHIEINVEDPEYVLVMEKVIKSVGEARNYSSTTKHLDEEQKLEENRMREEEEMSQAEAGYIDDEEEQQRAQCWKEWNERLEEAKQQDEELLMTEEESAKQYLRCTVMPVLSQGLSELCRIRPSNAVDFL
ncbi:adenylate kinase 7, partial [Silurus asotus]